MKTFIRTLCHKMGFDIIKYGRTADQRARLIDRKGLDSRSSEFLKMLIVHNIDLILDIGANVGEWADSLFTNGYEGRVVSFEPLSSAHAALSERRNSNKRWEVAERCAIGDRDGEIEINISENSQSSSILPMLSAHTDAAPRARYIGSEKTKIYRLDTIAPKYLAHTRAPFMKLDVQGYEESVLRGGGADIVRD